MPNAGRTSVTPTSLRASKSSRATICEASANKLGSKISENIHLQYMAPNTYLWVFSSPRQRMRFRYAGLHFLLLMLYSFLDISHLLRQSSVLLKKPKKMNMVRTQQFNVPSIFKSLLLKSSYKVKIGIQLVQLDRGSRECIKYSITAL